MLQYVDSKGIRCSLGTCGMEVGSVDRRPWLGPLLLVRGWLAEERGFGYTRKHLTPMARELGRGGGGEIGRVSQYIFHAD